MAEEKRREGRALMGYFDFRSKLRELGLNEVTGSGQDKW